MKDFTFKLIGFITLLVISISLLNALTPFYWGNPIVTCKIQDVKKSQLPVGTLALGSSVMWNAFLPATYDSLTNSNSYNLSASGMRLSESCYIIENIVDQNLMPELETIILEISYEAIGDIRDNSNRKKYYYDTNTFLRNFLSTSKSDKSNDIIEIRKGQVYKYLHNLCSMGMIKEKLLSIIEHNRNCRKEILDNGFKDSDYLDSKRNRKRKKISSAKQSQHNDKVIQLLENWNDNHDDNYKPLLEYLDKLYNKLLSKDVKLICVLMPRLDVENYKDGLSFFRQISLPKLDYSNPLSNPKFWTAEVAVDKRHFNRKGAQLFTEKLVLDIQ